jgi:hypothetical protein
MTQNNDIQEMIEKYLKWRELVSQSLNDSPEKFMERVHLLNEVDELAKKIQKHYDSRNKQSIS